MILKYTYISVFVNTLLAMKFVRLSLLSDMLYSIWGNFMLASILSTICIYQTIVMVNFIQYLRYHNIFWHRVLAKMLLIFTINTAEIKFLILFLLLNLPIVYKYGIIVVAFFYNVNFMTLFFYELTNEHIAKYNTLAVYQNNIYEFFKNTQHLYFKYMYNRALLLFFIIFSDNWILDTIADKGTIYDKLGYVSLFNVITTIIYILFHK